MIKLPVDIRLKVGMIMAYGFSIRVEISEDGKINYNTRDKRVSTYNKIEFYEYVEKLLGELK